MYCINFAIAFDYISQQFILSYFNRTVCILLVSALHICKPANLFSCSLNRNMMFNVKTNSQVCGRHVYV